MVAISHHIGEVLILVHTGPEAEVSFCEALVMSYLQTDYMIAVQSFKDICCCNYNGKL